MLFGTRVEGLGGVTRALSGLGTDLEDLDSFDQIGTAGVRIARGFVHNKSGRLGASLQAERKPNQVEITSPLIYAPVQNYGWPARNITPQRFMQRTDPVLEPIARAALEQDVNQNIRRRGLQ